LEGEFNQLLESMKTPEEVMEVIRLIFNDERKKNEKTSTTQKVSKKKTLSSLMKRQNQIEETMLRTTHVKLYEKLENERSGIEKEK